MKKTTKEKIPKEIPSAQIPNGTDVCYSGTIQAKIGGYDGVDHLIVERDDGGPDVWSSDFVEGFCSYTDPSDGITYGEECFGVDTYTTICYNGECVKDSLVRANDPACGYVSPSPEDFALFNIIYDNKEIIALGTIAGALFITYS